jgi:hypothetical protein
VSADPPEHSGGIRAVVTVAAGAGYLPFRDVAGVMTNTSDRTDSSEGLAGVPRPARAVADHLAAEGAYTVHRPADRADGDLHLRPTGEEACFGSSEVAVEALASADPTVVVDAVAAAAKRGRFALIAAGPEAARAAHAVLTDPPGAASVDAEGHRTFYHVPDRLRVGSAGFGAIRADGELTWRETTDEAGVTDERTTRLVLEADGRLHAAFDEYTALACPSPSAFPYAYRRDADKRIHVTKDGREVGVYTSIREMKADAYVPVPDPLVPEVHLPDGAELAGRWAIASVGEGGVELLTE